MAERLGPVTTEYGGVMRPLGQRLTFGDLHVDEKGPEAVEELSQGIPGESTPELTHTPSPTLTSPRSFPLEFSTSLTLFFNPLRLTYVRIMRRPGWEPN